MTAKHRAFVFVDGGTLPDQGLIAIGMDSAAMLCVLSSQIHVTWALAAGGRLGVGNDPRYNQTRCFDPFPFAVLSNSKEAELQTLGEQLDAHRKRQQAAHPELTLTGMYNVLETLRSGEVLTAKERVIHEHGIVSVLRQLHDEIDAAVLDAYGWSDLLPLLRRAMAVDSVKAGSVGAASAAMLSGNPKKSIVTEVTPTNSAPARPDLAGPDSVGAASAAMLSGTSQKSIATEVAPTKASALAALTEIPEMSREEARRAFDEAILERLVALNAERAAEEARGLVRWLRPEFQNPTSASAPEQAQLDADSDDESPAAIVAAFKPAPWPKDAIEQVRAVADTLAASPIPLNVEELATRFRSKGPWKKRLPQLLEMLVTLGRAQESEGRYSGIGK